MTDLALDTASDRAAYAKRPYERDKMQRGRKFVSMDLDSTLVEQIDNLRGNRRRGLAIDDLLRRALEDPEMGMS